MIETVPVFSTMIASVGYDKAEELLVVTFRNGKSYEYVGVPEDVFRDLTHAVSVGKAFNDLVKGVYEHR